MSELVMAHCQRTFGDIANVSAQIRHSAALAYGTSDRTSNPYFTSQVQEFFDQLDAIRTFSNTILDAIILRRSTIDDQIIKWLWSGGPQLCWEKLKETQDILQGDGSLRPDRAYPRPRLSNNDKLTTCMTLFNEHKDHFHFLLAPDVWNKEEFQNHRSETHHDPQAARTTRKSTVLADSKDEYHTPREDDHLLNLIQAREMNTNREILEEAVQWLGALDCTKKHHDTLQLRQEGTCTWFSNTAAYQKWRLGGEQYLWLNGRAGCGKSVFVASTIEYLKDTLHDGEVLVFFYCDFRDQRSIHPMELMCSLLSQLFRHMLDLVVDPGDLPSKILRWKGKRMALLSDLSMLCELVWLAARRFDRLPIAVIDAVDECTDIDALSRALVELHGDVRLLVTSRPNAIIQRHFLHFPSLSGGNLGRELAGDIALHIKRELASRKQLRLAGRKMKMKISETLGHKADGRFRWVQCQLDALDWCATESDRKNMLNNLPEGLEETYEKILEGIDERKVEGGLARRTLGWLVVALAPLRLAQIIDGLSVDLVEPQSHSEIRLLVDRLSGLVSYSENTDVLTLSHFSVKEYLTCRTTLPTYRIVPQIAHAEVAITCMRYLSSLLKQPPSHLKVSSMKTFPTLSYVLSSCFDHLAHVDAQSITVLDALKLLGSDVHHLPSHWEYLCELCEDNVGRPYPPWTSFRRDFELHILIAYSSAELLKSYLSGSSPNPTFGINALVYAADLQKTEHALVLLHYGVDVSMCSLIIDNRCDPHPHNSWNETAFMRAVELGHVSVTEALLPLIGSLPPYILHAALQCRRWRVQMIEWLLCKGADVRNTTSDGNTVLHLAITVDASFDDDAYRKEAKRLDLVKLFIEAGCDPACCSSEGRTALEAATEQGYASVVEYLLSFNVPIPPDILFRAMSCQPRNALVVRSLLRNGANVHVTTNNGNTLLHLAVAHQDEEECLLFVKVFMEAGCDLTACNYEGKTILEASIEQGHVSVVEHLLSSNVSVPAGILSRAMSYRPWDAWVVRSLLRGGANVHVTMDNGDTLLHLTIAHWDEEECLVFVEMFIEAGCDPGVCNSKGKTALEAVIEQGYISIAEYLLSSNVPIPPDILSRVVVSYQDLDPLVVQYLLHNGGNVHVITDNGDTLLHLAIAYQDQEDCLVFVKMFIEAGCDPGCCNSKGKTPLEAALEQEYISVVEYLLLFNVPIPPNILSRAISYQLQSAQVVEATSDQTYSSVVDHLLLSNSKENGTHLDPHSDTVPPPPPLQRNLNLNE